VDVGLLGPVCAWVEGSAVVLGGPRERGVLAMLALAAPHPVSTTELIDGLWGDEPPASAAKVLQNVILRLRKAAAAAGNADGSIVTDGGGYRLAGPAESVDVHRVAERIRQARAAAQRDEPRRAAQLWKDALAQWRGEPLADVRELPFADAAAVGLLEQRWVVVEEWAAAELACGHHREVLSELRRLAESAPLREGLWCSLMLALHRCGRSTEALQVYRQLRRRLADELGVDPGREADDLQRAIAADDPSVAWVDAAVARQPGARRRRGVRRPRTRFIGRQRDVVEVTRLLSATGLVSVIGTAGVGKTRLALEVAGRCQDEYPGGVVFVELAGVSPDAPIVAEVAAAAGIVDQTRGGRPEIDALVDELGDERTLLVLDNCEHVLGAAAELAETLLQSCPLLAVLATSREALRADGEALWRLTPLPCPPADRAPEEIESAPAVRLFLDRANLASPGLAVSGETARLVARICEYVDGLPLAIELAAAALDALDLAELTDALQDRFSALISGRRTSDRHRTLWAAIDWSYQLLASDERDLLARLSVFAGSFGLAAAAAVSPGHDPERVHAMLRRLVDRSLVELGGESRFRLLDSIRAYARTRLVQYLDPDEAYRPLLDWACGWAASWGAALELGDRAALARFDAEHPNLTGALRAAIELGYVDVSVQLVCPLADYWVARGTYGVGRTWIREVLDLDIGAARPDVQARLLWKQAELNAPLHIDGERRDMERAVRFARESGDRVLLSRCLAMLGLHLTYVDGGLSDAAAALREAVECAEGAGDDTAAAIALERLATVTGYLGDPAEELRLLTHAEQRLIGRDAPLPLLWVWAGLALAHSYARHYDESRSYAERASSAARRLGVPFAEELMHALNGQLALYDGRLEECERHFDLADGCRARMGTQVTAAWVGSQRARAALAQGDVQRCIEYLSSVRKAEGPKAQERLALRIAVVAAAVGRIDLAASLLAIVGPEPVRELDPLSVDDVAWVSRLVQDAGQDMPAGDAAQLSGAIETALSELAAATAIVNAPPMRPARAVAVS
jgi:predicted ATPase/DNA-binding SARP family transcriptional activator